MNKKYTYRIIDNTGIEFLGYPHDDPLLVNIYSVLKDIGIKPLSIEKAFLYNENNEDVVYKENSKLGKVKIIKNNFGDIFIFPQENKKDILKELNKLFSKSEIFIKEDI